MNICLPPTDCRTIALIRGDIKTNDVNLLMKKQVSIYLAILHALNYGINCKDIRDDALKDGQTDIVYCKT